VLQNESDTCNFMLYEAYTSEEAALAHKQTAHYAAWRDKVASWMAQPRNGIKYKMLCPKK
jgi:autoinducer 2-degrading protein